LRFSLGAPDGAEAPVDLMAAQIHSRSDTIKHCILDAVLGQLSLEVGFGLGCGHHPTGSVVHLKSVHVVRHLDADTICVCDIEWLVHGFLLLMGPKPLGLFTLTAVASNDVLLDVFSQFFHGVITASVRPVIWRGGFVEAPTLW
jgi:hypothetical protein